MTMLILLRNYGEGHAQATQGTWDIAAVAKDEFDMEDKVLPLLVLVELVTEFWKD